MNPLNENRVALVTGLSSGIGAAIGQRLAKDRWKVVGLDLNVGDEFPTCRCDVTRFDQVVESVENIRERHGPIGAAVTAAGFWALSDPFEFNGASWSKFAAVHLGGTANVARAVLPQMRSDGRGSVVFITTDLALNGDAEDVNYVTAKGAVLGLMRGLAYEFEGSGVSISTVAPGATDTPILPPDSVWRTPEKLSTLPLPRLIAPSEIAEAVAFLCDQNVQMNGQIVSPNAGQAR
ncbi:SDR family oxidoreductase [Rhizobium sp. CCGE 510]|uniref:SDR family NAD(P)-dependent oxidoreductase n=1 Tax=Rhizobium sp. CCGE 510 TaxID=1132836 RepID=UPI00027B8175|nr:SDR family oxidoreductase [Rhizobium sp. CCGE 510]EJT04252.1 short-chain dehydrogenase/reductase SDR [Rhizobium sp. CCGE 510]